MSLTARKSKKSFGFVCLSSESYSNPDGHLVSIHIPDLEKYSLDQSLMTIPVKILCSCVAWWYWGSAYHSTQDKYKQDWVARENRRPDIRDPNMDTLVCKHALRVAKYLSGVGTVGALLQDFGRTATSSEVNQQEQILRNILSSELSQRNISRESYENDLLTMNMDNFEEVFQKHGLLESEEGLENEIEDFIAEDLLNG